MQETLRRLVMACGSVDPSLLLATTTPTFNPKCWVPCPLFSSAGVSMWDTPPLITLGSPHFPLQVLKAPMGPHHFHGGQTLMSPALNFWNTSEAFLKKQNQNKANFGSKKSKCVLPILRENWNSVPSGLGDREASHLSGVLPFLGFPLSF